MNNFVKFIYFVQKIEQSIDKDLSLLSYWDKKKTQGKFLSYSKLFGQKITLRFFNFIISLSITILENMTSLEKYQKLQLSIELSKKNKI